MQLMGSSSRLEAEPGRSAASELALVEFSSALATAHEAEELRAALRSGLDLIAHIDGSSELAICEISAASDGRPLIVWQAVSGDRPEIAENRNFEDWFRRARASARSFEAMRDAPQWGALTAINQSTGWESFAGFFVSGAEPDGERLRYLSSLARLVAAALARIERSTSEEVARRRLATVSAETLAWLEFGVDIVWEAASDGVMRCRRVLNRRADLAGAIEGANLQALIVGAGGRNLFDLLQVEPSIRHMRAQISEGPAARMSADNIFYVSAMQRENDISGLPTYVGTLTSIPARSASPLMNEATAALSQVRSARHREERRRVEDDAMLEGLRLLLDSRTPREKLARLTELLCENMGGEEAVIVEPGFDGRPRMLIPAPRILDRSAGGVVDEIAAATAESRFKLYAIEDPTTGAIREALKLNGGSIVAFALPLRGQAAYLLCTTDAAEGLSADGIVFAERFAFILRQALLLREEQAQLAQTAKMAALGQMSASIAHELKQPLNTISLATQNLEALLSSPKFDAAAVGVKIARVLAQVDRAANVIDRMRRFGRKSVGESAAVSVDELVEGVLLMIRHVLEHAGVTVELDLAEGLTVQADELQLEQVLTNLIQNATDAISGVGGDGRGEAGGGKIRIRSFTSPERQGEVVLRIEDNGPGFPPGVIKRALEPFFTTKPAEQGTGLGLAICDTIIRESGGHLALGNHEQGGFVALTMQAALTAPSETR